MTVYAKGKSIPTYQFRDLFVQGEKFAEDIVFILDRYQGGNDLADCDLAIRGLTEEGWETQQVLSARPGEDGTIAVPWSVGDLFTLNAGKLRLELRASRMEGDVSAVVVKFLMEPVNVAPTINGRNGALPDAAEQAVSTINAAVSQALTEMADTVERYDLEHTGQRLDRIEADTAVYLARPEVIPMTREEYASSVHKANALYVIVEEETP